MCHNGRQASEVVGSYNSCIVSSECTGDGCTSPVRLLATSACLPFPHSQGTSDQRVSTNSQRQRQRPKLLGRGGFGSVYLGEQGLA